MVFIPTTNTSSQHNPPTLLEPQDVGGGKGDTTGIIVASYEILKAFQEGHRIAAITMFHAIDSKNPSQNTPEPIVTIQ